jgi:hypothetical protein
MKRFIMTIVAVAGLSVLGSATVEAAPGKGAPHGYRSGSTHINHVGPVHVANVAPARINHATHTNLLVHGRYLNVPFRVAGYRNWSYRCWFPSYRSYGYYSPVDSLWYYWYAPLNQYLPVTYMSLYPPTQYAPPVGFAPNPVMPQGIVPPSGASLVPGPITYP